ncbi:UNKNOWN [Stylonychia lemnae]|uniref:Uncharacterized protein n=1 Tax=Stylonychia lemnae TaxID=5949 RepID=A0A078A4S8_STYLE|nr:UNKNOWN [Stylonychia lemnae]|eukprot:CDW76859.1 UNKNOWN [Stylonychia lemnae]
MAKKNSRKNAQKRHKFIIRQEQEREQEAVKRQQKREEKDKRERGMIQKKPKVPAVMSSEAKKKKLLAKQLKSLSLGDKNKKSGIHRKDSSDSDDSDAGHSMNQNNSMQQAGGMDVDMMGGKNVVSKGIKKKNKLMSRAYYMELKKAAKRLAKSGIKQSKK